MTDYREIVGEIEADVAAGRLRPGDRLPPQRVFAHEKGIANSTAGRVYAELIQRGIATGEIGRGTFIRAASAEPRATLAEPAFTPIDLQTNYPILPDQHQLLAPALNLLATRADALDASMQPVSCRGSLADRETVATAFSDENWQPEPASILFAGNGRQALAAAFSALVPVGGRIGFEARTYPVANAIATKLGITAVPLAMDKYGLIPDAAEAAHDAAPLQAIYVQPTLHNPTGITMSTPRREELANVLRRLNGPIAIEDRVYAFLEHPAPPPLASFAPDHVVVADSLSKRISPGLTLGLLSVPARFVPKLEKSLIFGAWNASGFALDICIRWLASGVVSKLEAAKREDAQARQMIARTSLAGLNITANPSAYHLLLELPPSWRAEDFVQKAKELGITITPSSAFTVAEGYAPNSIRIALSPPPLAELKIALDTLANLVGSKM